MAKKEAKAVEVTVESKYKKYEVIEDFTADIYGRQFQGKKGELVEISDDEIEFLKAKVK